MAVPGSLIKKLCEETTCPVCLEYFTDPVITECGHNFCRACITQPRGGPGTDPSCPECREPVQQNNLKPNRKLANIAELSKKSNIQKMKGNEDEEGACKMHQEPLNLFCKDDKAPICVVCKKSKEHREHQVITQEEAAEEFKVAKGKEDERGVCEAHQEPLNLFCKDDKGPICVVCKKSKEHRGHWVITLEEAAKEFKNIGVCLKHQKPLKLFCLKDEAPICVLCDKEHVTHQMIPVEEAVEEYKKKIQVLLQSVEKNRDKMGKQKEIEQQKNQKSLKQLEEEKQKIISFFMEMQKFLKVKEGFWLSELAGLEKEIKRKQEENLTRLSKEISNFSDLTKEVEEKCQQPPGSFLQDIKGTLKRCLESQKRQPLELTSGMGWRFKKDCLKTSILKEVLEEFKAASLKGELNPVSVTLDPDTANSSLILPADLKSVTWKFSPKKSVPNNPERFLYMSCVLGHEIFTSGKHFWEVKVESLELAREEWAVGVATDSVKRHERISFSPNNGIWAVGIELCSPQAVWAYTSPTKTLLTSESHELRRIWVFLDCNEGRVEFVDADTDNWLYSFPPASFSGVGIRPFFWVSTTGAKLKC